MQKKRKKPLREGEGMVRCCQWLKGEDDWESCRWSVYKGGSGSEVNRHYNGSQGV
jgi:hypothetical protein